MKINPTQTSDMYRQYAQLRTKPGSAPVSHAGETDKVELTSEALSFTSAFKAARESILAPAELNTARIDDIRQRIADNTYSVPGVLVAERMLSFLS